MVVEAIVEAEEEEESSAAHASVKNTLADMMPPNPYMAAERQS